MNISQKNLAAAFNEWAKRWAENPAGFEDTLLDKNGELNLNYGETCARYLTELAKEMFSKKEKVK